MRTVTWPLKESGHTVLAHLCSACVIYFATIHLMIIPVDGYTAIGEVKRHSFLCASVVFVILILFLSLELWLVQTSRKKHKKPRNLETICFFIAAFLYLGFTALSGVASPYSGVFWGNTRYDGILTIGLYVICALILSELLVPQRWMLELFGLTVCLFCLIGITQLAGTNPFNLYPGDYSFYDAGIYYAGQYWSTIGNVNLCAALLSVASGSFIAAFVCGNGLRIWLCMVPLSLSVFSIFSLNSEAGIVSILFGSLLIAPFIVTDMKSVGKLFCAYGDMSFTIVVSRCCLFSVDGVTFSISKAPFVLVLISSLLLVTGYTFTKVTFLPILKPKQIRACLVFLVCMICIISLVFLYTYDAFPDGFLSQAHELLHANWDDSFGSGRLYIWRQVWEKIHERPLLGGGPDTLGLRGLTGWSRFNDVLGATVSSTIDAAHNEYLNIWVNQGLLSLVPYLGILGLSMLRWWNNPDNIAASIAGGAILFYSIQAFFGISMCITAPYLWIALAIVNNKNIYERKNKDETSTKTNRA